VCLETRRTKKALILSRNSSERIKDLSWISVESWASGLGIRMNRPIAHCQWRRGYGIDDLDVSCGLELRSSYAMLRRIARTRTHKSCRESPKNFYTNYCHDLWAYYVIIFIICFFLLPEMRERFTSAAEFRLAISKFWSTEMSVHFSIGTISSRREMGE